MDIEDIRKKREFVKLKSVTVLPKKLLITLDGLNNTSGLNLPLEKVLSSSMTILVKLNFINN